MSNTGRDAGSMPKAEETSVGRWLIETALLILLAFVIAQGVKAFVVQPFVIPTESMVPTIQVGNRVFAEKLTYRFFHEPRRGDVVVFDDPSGTHPQLIKRVVALEGETVEIKDNKVFIDGVALEEPYTHGKPSEQGPLLTPIVVPAGAVWLMGDNRTDSMDARWFGPQPVERIRGRAFFTYWPVREMGSLK